MGLADTQPTGEVRPALPGFTAQNDRSASYPMHTRGLMTIMTKELKGF